jgi:hypothetical protein
MTIILISSAPSPFKNEVTIRLVMLSLPFGLPLMTAIFILSPFRSFRKVKDTISDVWYTNGKIFTCHNRKEKKMRTPMIMVVAGMLALAAFGTEARSEEAWKTLTVIQDATKGTVSVIDLGEKGNSPGDITTWNEPLLDEAKKQIGTSSGFCIRTVAGQVSECQYTLTMPDGAVMVAGRETDTGTSRVAVIGGTGAYAGVIGEDAVTHNADGTFTDVLKLKKTKP